MPEPQKTKEVTIAISTSLSPAIEIDFFRVAAIVMPSGWDAANLTFQASADGITYNNLYDDAGNEITVTAAASRHIGLDAVAAELSGCPWLKIRSGTSGVAVNQTAARTLKLVLNL